jgi:hypothetical protein
VNRVSVDGIAIHVKTERDELVEKILLWVSTRLHKGVGDGRPVRTHREWHENGQMAVERVFDDHGDLMRVRRWDENGVVTEERLTRAERTTQAR